MIDGGGGGSGGGSGGSGGVVALSFPCGGGTFTSCALPPTILIPPTGMLGFNPRLLKGVCALGGICEATRRAWGAAPKLKNGF